MVNSMARWEGKVAIVTGASSGIGAAIAERLVERGLTVVGLARRKERIDELGEKLKNQPGKLYSLKADMTVEDEIIKAINWTKENVGPISILVNNAGIFKVVKMTSFSTESLKRVFGINVVGLSVATREVIKNMEENQIDGHIIQISSVASHESPGGGTGVYCASKASVNLLAEALRKELVEKKSKIKISIVSPGMVATEIFDPEELAKLPIDPKIIESMPKLKCEDIADATEYILSTPPSVQIHEMVINPIGV